MVTLGAVVHEGDESMRAVADGLLQRDKPNDTERYDIWETKRRISPKLSPSRASGPSGKHISLLKEYGDRIGQKPTYADSIVRDHPPLFQSILSFDRSRHKGEGKSKKEARQMAAHRACGELRIIIDQ